ncbi:S41 family peptidase [Pedobacter panaciterrae]
MKEEISFMIGALQSRLTEDYFDKKKGIDLVEKLTKMEKRKEFDGLSSIDATKKVTDFLRKETGDKHFSVSAGQRFPEVKRDLKSNPGLISGFSKVSILDKTIGYIKWDLCIAGDKAFQEIRKVLDSLSDCKSLIFDISENPGGDGASSAFINQFLYRSKDYQTLLQKKCNNEKDWRQSEIIFNYSEGPIFFDIPVYIITSQRTFSAAEYFAFTAKKMRRAIILGEATAGAGNPGTSTGIALANSDIIFWMFIPNCQIQSYDGDSIEGKGVKPDVKFAGKNLLNEALEYIRLKHKPN